tara:strand:- start:1053 stop:1187 length:135 start_codon:yes stop_codon:yes gene_type:complete
MWWLNHKIYKNMSSKNKERSNGNSKNKGFIEGEYNIIDDDSEFK